MDLDPFRARIDELFLAADRLPPAERAAFLERACTGDSSGIMSEVLSLLASGSLADEGPQPAAPLNPSSSPAVPGYEILDVIGRGGHGIVYRARHRRLGRIVALKMLLAGPGADAEMLARFRAEAETIARLPHPNIVQLYELGEHADCPFFALEYCDGGTLARLLSAGPLAPNRAAQLVAGLARAVQAAHGAGVVHRDLKPANVLLSGGREPPEKKSSGGSRPPLGELLPKIADFGLVKLPGSDLTVNGAVLGTPSYMAPEQAEARKEVGPLADVYSLGAILYECLTGRPPFRAATPLETLQQVADDEPALPQRLNPAVPRDLETICLKCLEKEPSRRYATAAQLADDLERFLAGQPVLARPVGPLTRALKWSRRHPAWAALAAVSAVAAVVVALVFWNAHLRVRAALAETIEQKRQAEATAAQLDRTIGDMSTAQVSGARFALAVGQSDLARTYLSAVPIGREGWEWWYLRHAPRAPPLRWAERSVADRRHQPGRGATGRGRSGQSECLRLVATGGRAADTRDDLRYCLPNWRERAGLQP